MILLHPLVKEMGIIDIENQDTAGWPTGDPGTVGAAIRSVKWAFLSAPPLPPFLNRALILLGGLCSGLGFLGQFRPESYAALATSAFCFSLT
jgi:hypothetical protein